MKRIPKQALIFILQHVRARSFDLEDMECIFETYGDDWYVVDGKLQFTKRNERRVAEIKRIKKIEKEAKKEKENG